MKYKMEQLFNRGYRAVVQTGKIGVYTTLHEFLDKIDEEVKETKAEFSKNILYPEKLTDRQAEEITDIMETCKNMLIHYKRNPINEIEKVVLKKREKGNP
jgi:retron-type reverse transcriptase